MGDGYHRALVLLEVLLEPVDALGVEVVGGLVEQEHVGLLKEEAAEGHPAALTSREVRHGRVSCGTAEGGHGAVEARVDIPCVRGVDYVLHLSLTLHQFVHLVRVAVVFFEAEFLVYLIIFFKGIVHLLHALHHVLLDRLVLVERRVLRQVAHAVARAPHHIAARRLLDAGDDLEERRFARAVETDDAYLGAVEERQIYVLEYLFAILGNNL